MTDRILGAVLAGGASSRFGSDKALAMLAGRPLLDHAAGMLARVVDEVVVVGRGDVDDVPRPGLGPLGGIAGALDHAARHGFASVVTIGCDMLRLPEGLLEALLERAPAYCREAPVLGHWPAASGARLLAFLDHEFLHPGLLGGQEAMAQTKGSSLSVRRWAMSIGAVAVSASAPIPNINTPADLAAL